MQCVKTLCNDSSDVKYESIEVYPQLAIGEVGTVLYNSTFFYLKRGLVDVSCTMKRNMIWLSLVHTVPDFSPGVATVWTPGPTGTTP